MEKLVIVAVIGQNGSWIETDRILRQEATYDEYVLPMIRGNLTYVSNTAPIPFAAAFAHCAEDQKIIVFPNMLLYAELLERHIPDIDSIHVIQLHREDGTGTAFASPPQMEWRPIVTSGTGITFTRYLHSPLEL